MIAYKRASTIAELNQIIGLQEQNFADSISDHEKIREGFVTVKHDLEILTKMNAIYPHIITKSNDRVADYAMCMGKKFVNEIEI